MKMFHPTRLSRTLRERRLPERRLQHIPITLSSFTLSAALAAPPALCLHAESSPIPHRLPFSSPLAPSFGKNKKTKQNKKPTKAGYLLKCISFLFSLIFFSFFWKLDLLSRSGNRQGLLESSVPTLSWLCVSSAHWEWMALSRIEKRPSV